MRSSQHNTQPADLQTIDVPIRVLVSESDTTSRRLICALLQRNPETSVRCVEDSQLLSTIDEIPPDLVIVDGLGADASPRVIELQAKFVF